MTRRHRERRRTSSKRAGPSPSVRSPTRSPRCTRSRAMASGVRVSRGVRRRGSERALARVGSSSKGDERRVARLGPARILGYAPAPHTLYTTHPDAVRAVLAGARRRASAPPFTRPSTPPNERFCSTARARSLDFAQRLRLPLETFPVPRQRAGRDSRTISASCARRAARPPHRRPRPDELEQVAALGRPGGALPALEPVHRSEAPAAHRDAPKRASPPRSGPTRSRRTCRSTCLAEARALADRFPRYPRASLLEMATAAGARALGRSDLGSLQRATSRGARGRGTGRPLRRPLRLGSSPAARCRRWVASAEGHADAHRWSAMIGAGSLACAPSRRW